MKNSYFKMIGQKSGNGKVILVAVVDESFFNTSDELPNIFEVQNIKMAPTIYSGIYPNIRVNTGTITSREDLKGMGIAGILTEEGWYYKTNDEKDLFGISLP